MKLVNNSKSWWEKINEALHKRTGCIRLGFHSKKQMNGRGYYTGDIISCIETGRVIEIEKGYNSRLKKMCTNITIEGKDRDGNPVVVIFSEEKSGNSPVFSIVTILPPTDRNRFSKVI
ncbi:MULTISPECIES: DUF4258 domain-containing protein [Pseudobacillus]|uniref:DUF4258 domain-containing protein n=1 Tax=Pseudobacillus TaxID=108525 RepID=UPI00387A303F